MFRLEVRQRAAAYLLAAIAASHCAVRAEVNIRQAIRVICAVGPEGKGNVEAEEAWRTLVTADAGELPVILTAMSGANALAANWLRSAVETIAAKQSLAKGGLPMAELGQFLLETSHSPRARRLAYELIARADPLTGERLLAGLINDPSEELRRDAVERMIRHANESLAEGNKPGATLLFEQVLTFARDVDQIDAIAKSLKTLGRTVDVTKTLGFVLRWKVAGPFDSTGGKGFERAYPPEEGIDFGAVYEGKVGKVRWQDFTSTEEYGVVSMNKPLTAMKGVVAYACAEFDVEHLQPAELRLGSENAFKVWLNGKFLFGQEEYHRNKAIDQYRIAGELRPGRNVILVKVCQNEQTEDWASGWDFQLRVCDLLGAPIRPASRSDNRHAEGPSTGGGSK